MYCKFCNNKLDIFADSSGFIVCPMCHRVNAVTALPIVPVLSQTNIVSQPAPRNFDWIKLSKINWRLGIIGLIGIFIICFGIFLLQKNVDARTQLSSAVSLDKKGDYSKASLALKQTQSPFVLASTKSKAAAESQKNKKWMEFFSFQSQAEILIKSKRYSDALILLNKISKDYPTYSFIISDLSQANQLLAAVQAASAQATKTVPAIKTTPPKASVSAPSPSVGCFAPTSITGKRYVSTSAFSAILSSSSVDGIQQQLQSFLGQYGVGIEMTNISPSSYVQQFDTYVPVSSAEICELRAYAAIFVDEWSKYPVDWVKNSGLQDIVLVKSLAVQGQTRAATPDVGGYAMYYSVTYSGDYAREVIHHEYDHLISYRYFNSYAAPDPTWSSYNPPSFSYGSGGISCYTPGNCLTGEHPIAGFVTGYAASAIEEDKAETYAYLMTHTYYRHLLSWIPSDSYLNNKVNNYKQFIASHSAEMSGSYFDLINP